MRPGRGPVVNGLLRTPDGAASLEKNENLYNYSPETFPEIKQSIARNRFRKFGSPAAEFSA